MLVIGVMTSCESVNSNNDSHFDADGYYLKNPNSSEFQIMQPSKVKFYVEVSGSMNGFFRANKVTHFKADLWNIVTYYSQIAQGVTILTNNGDQGANLQMSDFQTKMNTGAFISTASTKVPVMLQTIVNSLDADNGDVAVLVSDLKYSPVGSKAPDVLLTQYSTDVRQILGKFGKAASLICATSNYLDSKGNDMTLRSPYYYLILGKPECVAAMRNGISTLLENNNHFIDNIETGFDWGQPKYTFGISNMCEQLDDEPTFVGYEEVADGDTCSIKLKVKLEDYRWIMANEDYFRSAFKVITTYNSEVKIGKVSIDVQNITGDNKQLDRKAIATVDLKVYNMPTNSEVLEWTLDIPDTDYTLLSEFFDNADQENDPTKSYSLKDFVGGMFYGGIINKTLKPNHILISKNN